MGGHAGPVRRIGQPCLDRPPDSQGESRSFMMWGFLMGLLWGSRGRRVVQQPREDVYVDVDDVNCNCDCDNGEYAVEESLWWEGTGPF